MTRCLASLRRVPANRVPRFLRYYQGTPTSCRPSRRASFPSRGRYHGIAHRFAPTGGCAKPPWAWGWLPGGPGRDFFRGDDRISQVPGEPRFPFAHVLRPRPADASLTVTGRSHGPRAGNDEGADNKGLSRLNRMASGMMPYVSRCRLPVTAQGSLPGAGQALPDGLLPAGFLRKVFNSLHVRRPPFPSFLAQSPYSPKRICQPPPSARQT